MLGSALAWLILNWILDVFFEEKKCYKERPLQVPGELLNWMELLVEFQFLTILASLVPAWAEFKLGFWLRLTYNKLCKFLNVYVYC